MFNVLVTGTLIRNPECRTARNGSEFVTVLLRVPTEDGGILASVIAFGDVAQRLAVLKAGDAVAVVGSAKLTNWTDKETGELKHGLGVTVSDVLSVYVVRKRRAAFQRDRLPYRRRDWRELAEFDDPIPFGIDEEDEKETDECDDSCA